jgi:hypothetical protein
MRLAGRLITVRRTLIELVCSSFGSLVSFDSIEITAKPEPDRPVQRTQICKGPVGSSQVFCFYLVHQQELHSVGDSDFAGIS